MKQLQELESNGECELYYFDESGFSQCSAKRYAWSPVGKPCEVTAFSHSHRLNVLGFLSRKNRLVYHSTTGSVTAETVIEAFDHFVAQKDPDAFAVVVLDNASMHRSMAFRYKRQEWANNRVYVVYLPAYSPELNFIEILWRKIKYEWLPLRACLTFDRLCEEVKHILDEYGNDKYVINFT